MSIAQGGNELETAAMQAEASSGVKDDAIVTAEASEDRLVHWTMLGKELNDHQVELSFRANPEFDSFSNNEADPIASGVLDFLVEGADDSGANVVYYDSAPPHWEAGEEINVHSNNFAGSASKLFALIAYEPVGEFSRSRLRNRD